MDPLSHTLPPFLQLPVELIQRCFFDLDQKNLGSVPQVCQLFRQISNNNELWLKFYNPEWKKTATWLGPHPVNWKDHIKRVQLAFNTRAHICEKLNKYQARENNHYTYFWSLGLPNEAIHPLSKKENKQYRFLGHGRDAIDEAEMYAAIGDSKTAHVHLESCESSKTAPHRIAFTKILMLLHDNNISEAHDIYLDERTGFIKNSPTLGWWISRLFCALHFFHPKQQQIFFSRNSSNVGSNEWLRVLRVMQGCILIWSKQNDKNKAFATMKCYEQMVQHILTKHGNKTTFIIPIEMGNNLFEDSLEAILVQKDSGLWWENWGDALVGQHFDGRASQLEKAVTSYKQALKHVGDWNQDGQIRLVIKLSKTLIAWKNKGKNVQVDPNILHLPLTIIPKTPRLNESNLLMLAKLVLIYQMETQYSLVLNILRQQQSLGNFRVAQGSSHLYHLQIKLHMLANDYKDAGYTWVKLCTHFFGDQNAESVNSFVDDPDDVFELLEQLIQKHPPICQEIIAIRPEYQEVQLGQAQALYHMGNHIQALKMLCHIPIFYSEYDVHWLYKLSQTNFIGVILYSKLCKTSESLNKYYLDMLEFHPKMEFFIYHNLAIRLYFEGYVAEALVYIEMAIIEDPDEAEAYRMKGLIHQKKEDEDLSKKAHDYANKIDPELGSSNATYKEEDLLVFPIK